MIILANLPLLKCSLGSLTDLLKVTELLQGQTTAKTGKCSLFKPWSVQLLLQFLVKDQNKHCFCFQTLGFSFSLLPCLLTSFTSLLLYSPHSHSDSGTSPLREEGSSSSSHPKLPPLCDFDSDPICLLWDLFCYSYLCRILPFFPFLLIQWWYPSSLYIFFSLLHTHYFFSILGYWKEILVSSHCSLTIHSFLFFFFIFLIVVKHTEHTTGYPNHFYIHSSVVLNTFIMLCNHHPSPDAFLFFKTGTLSPLNNNSPWPPSPWQAPTLLLSMWFFLCISYAVMYKLSD